MFLCSDEVKDVILETNILMKMNALALMEVKILVSRCSARKIVADSRTRAKRTDEVNSSKLFIKLPNMPKNPRWIMNKAFFAPIHFSYWN